MNWPYAHMNSTAIPKLINVRMPNVNIHQYTHMKLF